MSRTSSILNPKTGAILVASAVAAATTWNELEHRTVTRAVLEDGDVRIDRLSDLTHDRELMQMLASELSEEWGPFALLGFADVDEMARKAGRTVYVASHVVDGHAVAKGCVQTMLADLSGEPEAFAAAFPSFAELTSKASWKRSRKHGGDTAILLQITVFKGQERGTGFGSVLRSALLNMLGKDVRFALTTTPIDIEGGAGVIDAEDAATFTPAMKFHARGGAEPSAVLPGYKALPEGETSRHGQDVVVMRYGRDESGEWAAAKPSMRLFPQGPIERRVVKTAHQIESLYDRTASAVIEPLRGHRPRWPRIGRGRLGRTAVSLRSRLAGRGRKVEGARGSGPEEAP